jgi:hypothetical protein
MSPRMQACLNLVRDLMKIARLRRHVSWDHLIQPVPSALCELVADLDPLTPMASVHQAVLVSCRSQFQHMQALSKQADSDAAAFLSRCVELCQPRQESPPGMC